MTISQRRILIAALMFLLTIPACALPGQTVPPAPTADSVLLSTMIAETVAAARTQTAAPPGQVSETQAAESPVAMTGTNLEKTAEEITVYTDFDGGFEVAFPKGWLAVRPGLAEFFDTMMSEGADNPSLHGQMTLDKTTYDETHRLYAYPLRPDIRENVIFGFSRLRWEPGFPNPLDNEALNEFISRIERSESVSKFQPVVAQVTANGNGVAMIEISGPFTGVDDEGSTAPLYATLLAFKPTQDSVVIMGFTIMQDYQDVISGDINFVKESIKLLGP
ncbi:MAG: hypothetical protein AB1649_12035 [Chloroflexota bacterium]